MALATVRDLIGSSLLLANAINKGEDPDDDEYSDALDVLNSMLGSWGLEQLILPYIASAQYDTVAGQTNYAIGPTSSSWNGVRPTSIQDAWIVIGGVTKRLVSLEFQEYGDIPFKVVSSQWPEAFMYNASYPDAFFALYPTPSIVMQVIISYDAEFANVTLDTSLSTLPQGYVHAIRYGLAALIPAEYGKEVPQKIEKEAIRSKGVIKSSNLKALNAVVDRNLPVQRNGVWDWRIG